MVDTNSPLFICLLFGGSCGIVIILVGILYFFGRQFSNNLTAVTRHMEETFGLTNNNPKGIYPDLHGYVDGIEVAIDVQFHYYTGGGTSQRPWTRVRAQLPETPPLQVRSRHQKTGDRIDWPPRETGDPAFDQKYELFVPADAVTEEALTSALKEALMMADPPVHILNNVVLWTKVKTVKEPKLLERVVRSCVSVASAINN